jgi:hypothetical protein
VINTNANAETRKMITNFFPEIFILLSFVIDKKHFEMQSK